MKFGLYLGRVNPAIWRELTGAAERRGFESIWVPEHLVLPVLMGGSPMTGHTEPPIPPQTPTYDALGYLSYLAGSTTTIKLGTWVYVLGLRHPFVAARAIQTADVVSGGRLLLGLGAGWLQEEWVAAQIDFATRGRRFDEALEVCRRLWTEERVAHRGEFFEFAEVMFEPKPVQQPYPPIFIGGESPAALRRAATADGWMGMNHTPETAATLINALQALRATAPGPMSDRYEITVGAEAPTDDEIAEFARIGVDRLIVSPWSSTRDAVSSAEAFAQRVGLVTDGDAP
jgi:probable F420-dependent oxidoreductase